MASELSTLKTPFLERSSAARGRKLKKEVLASAAATALALQGVMVKEETKEPVRPFRGLDSPASLSLPHPGFSLTDTKESSLLRGTLTSFFSDKQYYFDIKTVLNMSSSATGAINSIIANAALSSVAEFGSLSALFNEYFIMSYTVAWEPVSMYNYPLTGVAATSVSSLPLGVAALQHAQPAYTSLTNMSNAARYAYHNSGRPFKYTWMNNESATSTVLVPTSTTTQSWNSVANASNYTGNIQFLSQPAPPALPISAVLGTFSVVWRVLFRVRL
jgi:hypothetical protein